MWGCGWVGWGGVDGWTSSLLRRWLVVAWCGPSANGRPRSASRDLESTFTSVSSGCFFFRSFPRKTPQNWAAAAKKKKQQTNKRRALTGRFVVGGVVKGRGLVADGVGGVKVGHVQRRAPMVVVVVVVVRRRLERRLELDQSVHDVEQDVDGAAGC